MKYQTKDLVAERENCSCPECFELLQKKLATLEKRIKELEANDKTD